MGDRLGIPGAVNFFFPFNETAALHHIGLQGFSLNLVLFTFRYTCHTCSSFYVLLLQGEYVSL